MSKSKKDYLEEKVKLAYHYSECNRFFRKVRAIVVKDDKVLLLSLNKNDRNRYSLPGGGIDDGENLKQAVKREVFEETGAIVKPIKLIYKSFYTVPMVCDGINFYSKRVEFFYICKFLEYKHVDHLGIEGEFDDKVRVVELDYSNLNKTKLRPKTVKSILKFIKSSTAFQPNKKIVNNNNKKDIK